MRRRPALTFALVTLLLGGLGFWSQADTPQGPHLVEDAVVTWRDSTRGFGSWSGFALNPEGTAIIAISDKGRWGIGTLTRDEQGRLTAAKMDSLGPLLDSRGNPLDGYNTDAEGLTIGADGRMYISYEGNHRVVAHDRIDSKATLLPRAPEFRALQNNSGLEALFTGPDGRVHAIPERSGHLERPYPVYRLDGESWSQPFSVPRKAPHLLTGADLGPDGRLYVLERDFSGIFGFATRVRRFDIDANGLSNEETLLDSPTGRYDNLEGIEVWEDGDGQIRVTLISDDNGSFFQVTQLVEFVLTGDDDAGYTQETPTRPRLRVPPEG